MTEFGEGLKIPEKDRQNLSKLYIKINEVLQRRNILASLNVVGGTKFKHWPRKDIDVTVRFFGGNITVRNQFPDELAYAESEFNLLVQIAEEAVSDLDDFSINRKIAPYADAEYTSRDILRHNGSVEIKTGATPIELTRESNF